MARGHLDRHSPPHPGTSTAPIRRPGRYGADWHDPQNQLFPQWGLTWAHAWTSQITTCRARLNISGPKERANMQGGERSLLNTTRGPGAGFDITHVCLQRRPMLRAVWLLKEKNKCDTSKRSLLIWCRRFLMWLLRPALQHMRISIHMSKEIWIRVYAHVYTHVMHV